MSQVKTVQNALEQIGELPSHMWIEGQRISIGSRQKIETCDPGSGTILATVPAGTVDDVDHAVAVAKAALKGPWADMMPKERGKFLWKAGEAIHAQIDRFALVETLDSGKPLKDAKVSVQRAADYFMYYAGMVDKLEGTTIPLGSNKIAYTEKVPVGVTGHIVPWNVPLSMVTRGIAPALACGNTAVVKPAEDTPLSAIMVAELLEEIGLPVGVVNVVTGFGAEAGQALTEHPDVRHITFTGSVATGKKIMHAAADHLASVTLELGGKSPHLILNDADLDRATPDIMAAVYKNAGQICSSGTRLIVEKDIHNQLVDRLAKTSEAMRVGHGLSDPDMGPLISNRQLRSVVSFTVRAKERGVEFACGGSAISISGNEGGHFFAPSVADKIDPSDELAQKEIFGPVLSVIPVGSVNEAIEVANNTDYGLAAGIHTRDINAAIRFAKSVEAGQVYINGYHGSGDTVPFGGFRDSGIGREKGLAGLDAYSATRAVTISL
ncbi:aldehyde dehydrogenase family protein [Alphaproteobacteria bacterium]|nr:aldehyde dehydrogenase family protein [Alphaproteobacteria bacterium]